jgi:TRAP-type C4-dicarboxylate transport system permease small subunit
VLKILRRCESVLARILEYVVTVIVAALVLDVLWGVVSRFVLGSPSRWTEEVAIFLLIWVSLLGAAVAFRGRHHLGVDYFVGKLDPGASKLLRIVTVLVVVLFTSWVMVYGGTGLVVETLRSGQRTPALGMLMGYVYLAVPVSGVFFVLFCLDHIASELSAGADDRSALDRQETI